MDPETVLDGGEVTVAAPTYAVCRTDRPPADAFAIVRDEAETTVVVEADSPIIDRASAVESGWRRLTFEMELPFELVGFLGVVASALAEAEVSVFVCSSFSTDHVFVRESDLGPAVERLSALGCSVERR